MWKFDVLRQTIVAQQDGGGPASGGETTATEGQPANGEQDQQAPSPFGGNMLLWLALIIGVFYFLMIRPQQKREKERREMLASISKGDKVVTQGGIMGKVVGLTEKTVVLRISEEPPVKIEMARMAVSRVLDKEEAAQEPAAADEGEEESSPADES